MRPIASALVALSLLSGCYNVHVRTTAEPGRYDEKETTLHFIQGLTPATIDAKDCTRGIAEVDFKVAWWSFFLGFIGGVETTYTCVKGSRGAEAPPAPAAGTPVASADPGVNPAAEATP
jgi:hypothetical protein